MNTPTHHQLLKHLSHVRWISGPKLAENLNITRAAIWKHINLLMKLGVPIVKSRLGYRLSEPFELLCEETIRQKLAEHGCEKDINLIILPTIPSTNTYAKKNVRDSGYLICLSEQQTAGKGRLGRTWQSPFGQNMYLSIAWQTADGLAKLSGLSIAVSIALAEALEPWIPNVQLKWPNDLIWQNQKLAGCLTEISSEGHGLTTIVVGLGLNINSLTSIQPLSESPHTSMRDILSHPINRNEVVAYAISYCLKTLSEFNKAGVAPFLDRWHTRDYLANKPVTIRQFEQEIAGTAQGIHENGHLIIQENNGNITEIASGEATIKKPTE